MRDSESERCAKPKGWDTQLSDRTSEFQAELNPLACDQRRDFSISFFGTSVKVQGQN